MNRDLDKIFSDIYQEYASYVYGVCLRYAKTKEDAEDIMQEGFTNIYKGLENFRDKSDIKTWMVRVIINTTIRYYRTQIDFVFDFGKHTGGEKIYETYTSSDALEQLEVQELLEVLNEMPNGYRIVFNLYCVEGYKHREIAQMLDISESTSKTQLQKAKVFAQKLLKEKLDINY